MRGSGELAARMRALDWSQLPAGPVCTWPESLRAAVSLCLASRHAIEIWWGPQYLRFYNDAYRPILGETKHPQFIGKPGKEMWAEIWDVIEPLLRSVRESGEAVWRDDLQLFMTRNGFLEETYFSFSYGPIFDGNEVAGIFSPCTETTRYVLQRRRLNLLRRIAAEGISETVSQVVETCVGLLREHALDIPFAALYVLQEGTRNATLISSTGLRDPELLPSSFEARATAGGPTFATDVGRAIDSADSVLVEPLSSKLGPVIAGPWQQEHEQALVVPLRSSTEDAVTGVLIAGISARLPYNEEYRVFLELLGAQLGAAVARTSALLQERRRSEELAEIFTSAPAFIAVLNGPTHVFRFANPAYMQLIGHRSAVGKPLRLALPEIEEQGFLALLDRVYATGVPFHGENLRVELQRTPESLRETRYVSFVYQPMKTAEGQVHSIFVLGMDVTETAMAHKALQVSQEAALRSEAQLKLITDALPEAVSYVDPDLRYVRVNEAHEKWFRRHAQELIGERFSEILDEESAPLVGNHLQEALKGSRQQFEFQMEIGGEERTLNVVHIPDLDEAGQVRGVIIQADDVTDRKRALELLVRNEKLAATGRLAASIAHEINNPLESVTNLLYLARTAANPDQVTDYIHVAERELRRVSAISSQTLRFHKQSTRPTVVDAQELLDGVLALFQGRIVNSGISVEKRFCPTESFECFEGEIRQVLSNLVANAIDAMQTRGGRLCIRTRCARHPRGGVPGLVFTIADTGPGMPSGVRKRVFDAFYTTKGIGGTGLGLWVSKDIADRHHGTLRFRTSERAGAAGTVFTLFLPVGGATPHS